MCHSDLNGLNRSLRCLDQAYMIFFGKIIIAHFLLILSASLADNSWNVWHVCSCYFFYFIFILVNVDGNCPSGNCLKIFFYC
jgi:hypothetical protein